MNAAKDIRRPIVDLRLRGAALRISATDLVAWALSIFQRSLKRG
jgi:hypothetical protein